jgi:hypothetical protein
VFVVVCPSLVLVRCAAAVNFCVVLSKSKPSDLRRRRRRLYSLMLLGSPV